MTFKTKLHYCHIKGGEPRFNCKMFLTESDILRFRRMGCEVRIIELWKKVQKND